MSAQATPGTATPLPDPAASGDVARLDAIRAALGRRSIALIGMMGAGKTSVGRRLGAVLDLPFVDADAEIEAAANQTIPEIFEKYGEAHFRDGERRVIARLLRKGPRVIATGGGAVMSARTRNAIRRNAVSVWLKAEPEVLMARVRRKSNRPLLQQDDPEATLRRLIAERDPLYAGADITVMSRDTPHADVVHSVIAELEAWLAREARTC